jgi:hypothetical protein
MCFFSTTFQYFMVKEWSILVTDVVFRLFFIVFLRLFNILKALLSSSSNWDFKIAKQ